MPLSVIFLIGYLLTIFQVSYKNIVFYVEFCAKFSSFARSLLHYFISKKTAAENHLILAKVNDEVALSETMCRDWFRRFKSGNFDFSNKDREKPPKKFKDAELQELLDEDSTQTLKQLAKAL